MVQNLSDVVFELMEFADQVHVWHWAELLENGSGYRHERLGDLYEFLRKSMDRLLEQGIGEGLVRGLPARLKQATEFPPLSGMRKRGLEVREMLRTFDVSLDSEEPELRWLQNEIEGIEGELVEFMALLRAE